MLAVIEHLSKPEDIFKGVARVLKPGGYFIITTSRKAGELILKLYAKNIDREHKLYLDLNSLKEFSKGIFEVTEYHIFAFGFNQAFCLQKTK